MDRRHFMKTGTGALCGAGCATLSLPAIAADNKPHWTYEGETGPANWGDLSEDYAACGAGVQQSPIDLNKPTPAILGDVSVDWRPTSLNVVNNGHTIQANTDKGSGISIGGKRFDLLQFHFHHRSEHGVNGEQLPMEVHFVHQASDGSLAVLGAFLEAGGDGGPAIDTIDKIWNLAPQKTGKATSGDSIDPGDLLPNDRSYYRYFGSLTTPPCSEIVTWTVYSTPVRVTQKQIDTFAVLFENNARPFQALNRRFLLGTF